MNNPLYGETEPIDDDIFGKVDTQPAAQPFNMNPATLPFPGAVSHMVGSTPVLTIEPNEAKQLALILPTMVIRFQALKVVNEDSVVGIVYNNQACDFTLTVAEKYRLRLDDQELQVLYAGGKISFGTVTLLTLIAHQDQTDT